MTGIDKLRYIHACSYVDIAIYVTGFERTHHPRTQQEDILFTITR